MSTLIGVSLNLSKLDKANIITGKTGDKYINLTIAVNDEPDRYGKDVQVWNEQSKEQRERKEKKVYCGSGKVVYTSQAEKPVAETNPKEQDYDIDDLPF